MTVTLRLVPSDPAAPIIAQDYVPMNAAGAWNPGLPPVQLDCATGAALLKRMLRARFPGARFSVRSSRFAGGSSIRVSWTDGPCQSDVDTVADLFSGKGFDGMTDCSYYVDSVFSFEGQTYRAGWCWCNASRSLSEAARTRAAGILACIWGDWDTIQEGERMNRVYRFARCCTVEANGILTWPGRTQGDAAHLSMTGRAP